MEIATIIEKLHEVYRKGKPDIGCVDRAHTLYYIIKDKGFNPKIKIFYFKDKQGKKIVNNHCVVILNDDVYDANLEESQNPIKLSRYEDMKRKKYPRLDLIWEDCENYMIDSLWAYSSQYDMPLKTLIRDLIKEEYEALLKTYPFLQRNE